MGSVNVEIEGNVGVIKELRFLPDGTAVQNVSLACTPSKRVNEEWVDGTTMWFNLTFWKHQAERAAENLTVGDRLIVTGEMTLDEYEKKDGGTGQSFNVRVKKWGVTPKAVKPVGAATSGVDDPWQS
jgi:single-strand DNA-binding protein